MRRRHFSRCLNKMTRAAPEIQLVRKNHRPDFMTFRLKVDVQMILISLCTLQMMPWRFSEFIKESVIKVQIMFVKAL